MSNDNPESKAEIKARNATKRKKAAAQREQRRQTVGDNLLAGLNYRSIAEGLGVSLGTVANDVKTVMGRWRKEQLDSASEIVQLELTRLDRALYAIWTEVQAGDVKSIQTMLKLMERRAKLLGLDAPEKKEITGKDGGPIETKTAAPDFNALSDDELETYITLSEKLNPDRKDTK